MRPDLFAFATACAFFGAALYVNIVEQPARLALDARSIVREWMPSNRRGFVMLAVLAIISALSGLCGIRRHRRCALADRRHNHTGELALRLFRDDPGERLVVRRSPECSGFDDPRAHARLGPA